MYKRFILDANAIIELNLELINSKKDENQAIITIEDVAYEVRTLKEKLNLIDIQPLTIEAFYFFRKIIKMQSVIGLLDYYNNKGAGDVSLLAFSLSSDEGKLVKENYIVTNDVNLRKACDELGCYWIPVNEFKDI